MTRILVTGATGTVGGPLVDRLLERTPTVRSASRRPERARDRFDDRGEYVAFDLERPETWTAALDDVDRVFLVLPPGTGAAPIRQFVDHAGERDVSHVVFLSILGAESLPVIPHRRIEGHLAESDLAATFLRASYFMQNLSGIHLPEIRDDDAIYIPAGGGEISFVDAVDVAAVAGTVLTEDDPRTGPIDVTGPAALDLTAVAETFSAVLDRRIEYADPSLLRFGARMLRRGVDPGLVGFMAIEYTAIRFGLAARTADGVEEMLGRSPRSMADFVRANEATFQP
ncbi:MAG: NAD(P)H-binding protein [Halanaeroarchaeum sp.]